MRQVYISFIALAILVVGVISTLAMQKSFMYSLATAAAISVCCLVGHGIYKSRIEARQKIEAVNSNREYYDAHLVKHTRDLRLVRQALSCGLTVDFHDFEDLAYELPVRISPLGSISQGRYMRAVSDHNKEICYVAPGDEVVHFYSQNIDDLDLGRLAFSLKVCQELERIHGLTLKGLRFVKSVTQSPPNEPYRGMTRGSQY